MPRINSINSNRNRYTDEEKKVCVALLAQYGGGVTAEGIMACQQRYPSVSRSNLALWWNQFGDEVTPKSMEIIVEDPQAIAAYQSVDDLMFSALGKLLTRLNSADAINKASAKDAAIAAAIMIDKLMLRVGLSPELLTKVKRLLTVMTRKGYDPSSHLDDLIESYEQLPDVVK